MEKLDRSGMEEWRLNHEVLFNDTLEGKKAKWEHIKSLPEMEKVVLDLVKHFGKLQNIKVYRG
tara:strand:+ start:334 stop:522 length:189 start_codon:yes stop_codon:yes gene_type:complete